MSFTGAGWSDRLRITDIWIDWIAGADHVPVSLPDQFLRPGEVTY